MKKEALLQKTDAGLLEVTAPSVGLVRDLPKVGSLVRSGMVMGRLEILGQLSDIVAPKGAYGIVTEHAQPEFARAPVGYKTVLVTLDPEAAGSDAAEGLGGAEGTAADGLLLKAPMGGRFYIRPSPDKPPFVKVGDTLGEGTTIGLIEVMKTFNRVTYGGDGLPERAKVKAILVTDDEDIDAGQALLQLETE